MIVILMMMTKTKYPNLNAPYAGTLASLPPRLNYFISKYTLGLRIITI